MHIIFTKAYDIYVVGNGYILERTLGVKMIDLGVAIPYTQHLENEKVAELRAAKAKKDAKKAKAKADKKKAALLKNKNTDKGEKAVTK